MENNKIKNDNLNSANTDNDVDINFDKIYSEAIHAVNQMEENISHLENEQQSILEKQEPEKKSSLLSTVILAVLLVVILAGSYMGVKYYKPYKAYKNAVSYMNKGDFDAAVDNFSSLGDYKDSKELLKEAQYKKAVNLYEGKDYTQALIILSQLGSYKESEKLIAELAGSKKNVLAAGLNHSVGVKSIGRAVAVGDNTYGQCDVEEWRDITFVSAGKNHTVGITSGGKAVAVGDNSKHQCDVELWENLTAVQACDDFTIGLKADGSLYITGDVLGIANANAYNSLKNVVEISSFNGHTACLLKSGDVVLIGDGKSTTLPELKYCTAIACGNGFVAGIRSDKTLAVYGKKFNTADWTNIKYIEAGSDIFAIDEEHNIYSSADLDFDNALIVALGENHSIALMSDGTVKAVGDNSKGQCDVQIWRDILLK